MSGEVWHDWQPPVTAHVRGRFTPRTANEAQRYECRCERCGQVWKGECWRGQVKSKIMTFAAAHRDCPEAGGRGAPPPSDRQFPQE